MFNFAQKVNDMDMVGKWSIYIEESKDQMSYGPFILNFHSDKTFDDETYYDKGKWIADGDLVMWQYDSQPCAYAGNGSGKMLTGIATNFIDPALPVIRWQAIKNAVITDKLENRLLKKK
jgi:hypothetical protein